MLTSKLFLRAIEASWLVCFAVYVSFSSQKIGSKIFKTRWPRVTFVALDLDHVIASMYPVPVAIF